MNQIYRAIAILAIATALALFFYGLRINSYAIAILGIAPALALAVQLYLGQANAYCNRGFAQDRRGNRYDLEDEQAAFEDYNQAQSIERNSDIDPDDEHGYYGRALARSRLGDNQGAMEDLQKSAKLCSDHRNTATHQQVQETMRKLQQ